jgi:hypothetical protein
MRSLFILSLFLCSAIAQADPHIPVTELAPFTSVKSEGTFDVEITVGPQQSVIFEGQEKTLKKISVKVVNGELQLRGPQEMIPGDEFTITLPSLHSFKGKGVGEVDIKQIRGDKIDLSYEGAGSLEASGSIKNLRLTGIGVGKIDTEKLHAENVDVSFQGVGKAEVYASQKLTAEVKGIGVLTYYGNPATVNKSGDGIGSIHAAKLDD